MSRSRMFVLAVILFIALFDIVTGLRLMLSETPWLVNGSQTLWTEGSQLQSPFAASLFQRLGAFSFHVGVITALWAILNRHRPGMITALLVTYSVTGITFLVSDSLYFKGTPYYAMKSAFGALWSAALIVNLVSVWKARAARQVSLATE